MSYFNPGTINKRPSRASEAGCTGKEEDMFNSSMKSPSMDKFINRLFRRADGVVWDLMSGKIGVQTTDGIATLEGEGADARVSINVIDEFGLPLPAFAQSTPVDAVKVGDIIYSGKERISWVIEKTEKGFKVMKPSGETVSWQPPKVSMLGLDSGVMVLRSLVNMLPNGNQGLGQMQNLLLPMLMMGGGDIGEGQLEKLLPLVLMSQTSGGDQGGMNQMLQTMMMMNLMGGGKLFGGK
jgi:hypothetical protein